MLLLLTSVFLPSLPPHRLTTSYSSPSCTLIHIYFRYNAFLPPISTFLSSLISGAIRTSLPTSAPLAIKFRGFYRGLLFPTLAAGAYNSIFFGNFGTMLRYLQGTHSNEHLRKYCCESGTINSNWHRHVMISGAVAGASTIVVGAPTELIKTQLQVMTDPILHRRERSKDDITGPYSCARAILKVGGIRALFTGTLPLLLREASGFSVYILSYEHMLCMFQGTMAPGQQPKVRYQIFAGGLAGALSWIIAMPLDVIKSRIQADNLANPKYKGMYDCLLKSYREEGSTIFMKGVFATSLRAFAANGITFLVFQYCMVYCEDFLFSVFPEKKETKK